MTQTTDQSGAKEVDAFNALADEWWDPNGPMRPLHQLNPTRLSYIQSQHTLAGTDVLDLGCGGGLLSEAMAQSGAHVTGIDLSPDLIACAQQHARQNQLDIEYHQRGIAKQAEDSKRFPLITCLEMLEHVDHPDQILQYCAECLSDSGTLIVSTLNRTPKAFLLGIIAAEYIARLLPRGTHDYQKFIRPSELTQWAEAAGLELIDCRGIEYQFFRQRCVLSHRVDINYIATFRKRTVI